MSWSTTYPLLVVIHGAGASAESVRSWIEPDSMTDAAGFIAVYPDGIERSWDVGCGACTPAGTRRIDDVLFVNTLIGQLADSLPVDPERVLLVGHSLGAQFVHHYACTSSRSPAGAVAVSGLMLRRQSVGCRPRARFPVMLIHGDADPVLAWEGSPFDASALSMPVAFERWAELMECQGPVASEERADTAGDGTSVLTTSYVRCAIGATVVLHRLRGAGHNWPGVSRPSAALGPATRNFDGLTEALSFFERFAPSR
jgi:polyhydroxybutyrate depolymerase